MGSLEIPWSKIKTILLTGRCFEFPADDPEIVAALPLPDRRPLINNQLNNWGFNGLPSFMTAECGGIEALAILFRTNFSWDNKQDKFKNMVFFVVQWPNGKQSDYRVIFNPNSISSPGAVFIPIYNGQYVFVEQPRFVCGQPTIEFPRGYGKLGDERPLEAANRMGEIPALGSVRELMEECGNPEIEGGPEKLGKGVEDSSINCAEPTVYLVKLRGKPVDVDKEFTKVRLYSSEDVWSLVEKGLICDYHTTNALAIAHSKGLI